MMKHEPPQIKDSDHLLHNIGIIFDEQRKYDEALEYYEQALKMKEKYNL
jgi:tetratricopeptide (TPR) repeat protein